MVTNILSSTEQSQKGINSPSGELFKGRLDVMPPPRLGCICAFLTSTFILQPYHIRHKQFLMINFLRFISKLKSITQYQAFRSSYNSGTICPNLLLYWLMHWYVTVCKQHHNRKTYKHAS